MVRRPIFCLRNSTILDNMRKQTLSFKNWNEANRKLIVLKIRVSAIKKRFFSVKSGPVTEEILLFSGACVWHTAKTNFSVNSGSFHCKLRFFFCAQLDFREKQIFQCKHKIFQFKHKFMTTNYF